MARGGGEGDAMAAAAAVAACAAAAARSPSMGRLRAAEPGCSSSPRSRRDACARTWCEGRARMLPLVLRRLGAPDRTCSWGSAHRASSTPALCS